MRGQDWGMDIENLPFFSLLTFFLLTSFSFDKDG